MVTTIVGVKDLDEEKQRSTTRVKSKEENLYTKQTVKQYWRKRKGLGKLM